MNINEEAVEAAAKAIYATEAYPIYDEAKEVFTGHKPWEWLNEGSWASYRTKARAAMEAAAPYLMAEAWDEGVDWVWEGGPDVKDDNPYRSEGTQK